MLGADDGAIGLYVPRRHTVQIEAIHRLPSSELGLEFEPGEGLIGRVLATGQPVIVARYGELDRLLLPDLHDNTEGTVKGYVSTILAKLELKDRTQAALFAVQRALSRK